ncbi:MAG: hypothetical protein ACI80K_002283 [Paracoccaceae bacterium]|jgi:hypothetical protein
MISHLLRQPRPLVLLLVCAASACQSYNQRIEAPLRDFERGDFLMAAEQFADPKITGSEFLSGVEAGTAAFVDGDFDAALAHLHTAELHARETEQRALLGGESLAEMLTTFFVNEGHASYVGEGYERAMLHAMLGLSYLALGRLDDVQVEARRIDDLITSEEELYGSSYGAGGMAHLLSAISYELQGEPSEAYIDYERMYDKGLAPELVGAALIRLSGQLSQPAGADRWVSEFGEREPVPLDWPSIVVLGGLGMGPAKHEHRIDIALPKGIFSWAVPVFGDGKTPTPGLELVFPDQNVRVGTSLVEHVAAVAKENLDDRIAWLATRSAVRGILKRELAIQLSKNDNEVIATIGAFLAVASLFTERADLRTWRTLPNRWVAARAFVPPDEPTEVILAERGGEEVRLGHFRLQPGETMFVFARSLQSGLVAHVIGGERVQDDTGLGLNR